MILPRPFIINSVETRFGHDFLFFLSQNILNTMCDIKLSLIQIVQVCQNYFWNLIVKTLDFFFLSHIRICFHHTNFSLMWNDHSNHIWWIYHVKSKTNKSIWWKMKGEKLNSLHSDLDLLLRYVLMWFMSLVPIWVCYLLLKKQNFYVRRIFFWNSHQIDKSTALTPGFTVNYHCPRIIFFSVSYIKVI